MVSFLIKVQPASLQFYQNQKRNPINVFSCEVCQIFENIFFIESMRTRLLLCRLEAFLFRRKILYFPFFHQSGNLPFSGVDVRKPNEACIALKP